MNGGHCLRARRLDSQVFARCPDLQSDVMRPMSGWLDFRILDSRVIVVNRRLHKLALFLRPGCQGESEVIVGLRFEEHCVSGFQQFSLCAVVS